MATSQMSGVIQHLRRAVLLRDGAGLTDGQLLTDYISRRDEAALAALLRRHGPMVWGVCRRVLSNYHDAEDAFQATFLVLVRRASSIASRELLANWLYGVAHQTALKARATIAKRKVREKQVTEMPEPAVVEQDLWNDLQPLLDQELSRLPDSYRAVIVLCDLEGKTRKEAARQLDLPEGTVASRLARARVMLAKRLARHGLAVSGGALGTMLSQSVASAGVPTSVVSSTIKAASLFAAGPVAAGLISVKVAALTQGVLKTMLLTDLKIATTVLLVFAILGAGVLGLTRQSQAADPTETPQKDRPQADKPKSDLDKLQGTWVVVSVVQGGEEISEKVLTTKFAEAAKDAGKKLPKEPKEMAREFMADNYRPRTIDGNKLRFQTKDDKYEADFKIDPTKDPKEWDDTVTVGAAVRANKGVPFSLLKIYKLEGDTLTTCGRFAEDGRPTEFKSTKEGREILAVYKRKPPAADKKDAKQPEPPLRITWLIPEVDGKRVSMKDVMINNVQRKLDANMKKLAESKDEKAEREALEAIEKNVKELRDALDLLKGKKGDK